jgi:UBX domain-containing protein 1
MWYLSVHLVLRIFTILFNFLVIGPTSSSRRDSHTEVTLKLWKEGFSINDGAVREYADPANTEFLESVRRG